MYKYISFMLVFVFLSGNIFCDSSVIQNSSIDELDGLWKQFMESSDSETRAGLIISLGKRGKGSQHIIDSVNNYLMEINSLYRSGISIDYILVSACITAVMDLNDASSYPVLFAVLRADYPEVITNEAYGALDIIDGNLKQFLSSVLEKNPPEEKFAAFKAGMNSDRLSVSERGQLIEHAFELAITAVEENAYMNAMRYSAALALTSLRWTRANALAIRHYYRVQADFLQGIISKDRLVEAIACLGAVGNSEAALILGLQLGLINARTETRGIFDADITLAIVLALGLIGDNAAFDHLLLASNLEYGDTIITAARESINKLKW